MLSQFNLNGCIVLLKVRFTTPEPGLLPKTKSGPRSSYSLGLYRCPLARLSPKAIQMPAV